ncbi:SubName: Full=Uncharacterized protein {ECO:0000313/EMBL:CCA71412.1} [Serendipita indica DSM 11827]|nr:SubName: Full=Uncharacterized protein {ECO:0000313/EMBL:CCA71412.1} [Serendipita indica DSM 11827]
MPAVPSEDQHERHEASQTQMLKDRRFKLNRRTSTLEERMAQLEALIQSMPANIFQTTQKSDQPPPSATSERSSVSFPAIAPFPTMGVLPPGFSTSKLTNPATHFVPPPSATDNITTNMANVTLSPTYLYWDDEGFTRWQGASSGLPLLDSLVERSLPAQSGDATATKANFSEQKAPDGSMTAAPNYFPDRLSNGTVTASIPPDLMDGLVQSYLSTTFYLMPFLHIPTFLHDYSNPTKWGEPGFVSFVTAVCCLASRHVDDKRVREDANDPFSSGTHWFGLFNKLRALPAADRPTLYTVQAVLVAAVYAVGLGRLSKGFSLLSEAVTLSIDAGLHRSSEAYDCFDQIETEIRKRTFWAVYMWDKQVGAAFGRPPLIRLRDCDVPEPTLLDDEMTAIQNGSPKGEVAPRLAAFVAAIRYIVVLEAVLDGPPPLNPVSASSFLTMASTTLVGFRRNQLMQEEEALLDEAMSMVPSPWLYTADGTQNPIDDDVIQTTQKHRLHCLEQWVRMLIHRQRLTVALFNGADEEAGLTEVHEMIACYQSAVNLIHSQLQMATHALMGFFGVGAIHQLNQAGRTLVAVLLNCRTSSPFIQQQLVEPGLEALRSCVVLLRRFSVRYLCGLRSADLIEEFCRISNVPLNAPPFIANTQNPAARRAWLRPIRKKTTSVAGSGTSPSDSGSPSTFGNHHEGGVHGNEVVQPSNGVAPSALSTSTSSPQLQPGYLNPAAAFDAYEALINPPPPPSTIGMTPSVSSVNGLGETPTSTYASMNGTDLMGETSPDDILALLSNTNYEAPFDFGMLYSADGNSQNPATSNPSVYSPMGFSSLNASSSS